MLGHRPRGLPQVEERGKWPPPKRTLVWPLTHKPTSKTCQDSSIHSPWLCKVGSTTHFPLRSFLAILSWAFIRDISPWEVSKSSWRLRQEFSIWAIILAPSNSISNLSLLECSKTCSFSKRLTSWLHYSAHSQTLTNSRWRSSNSFHKVVISTSWEQEWDLRCK